MPFAHFKSEPKNAIIYAVFVKRSKTSETRTDIGGELIGRVKQRTEADSPIQPSPQQLNLQRRKAIAGENVRSSKTHGDTWGEAQTRFPFRISCKAILTALTEV